jgi:hypothetical protein
MPLRCSTNLAVLCIMPRFHVYMVYTGARFLLCLDYYTNKEMFWKVLTYIASKHLYILGVLVIPFGVCTNGADSVRLTVWYMVCLYTHRVTYCECNNCIPTGLYYVNDTTGV